jgi:hypothetical protein
MGYRELQQECAVVALASGEAGNLGNKLRIRYVRRKNETERVNSVSRTGCIELWKVHRGTFDWLWSPGRKIFSNIYSVPNTFVASVTAEVFGNG